MIAIDSNVLLRIALGDDAAQLRIIRAFLKRLEESGERALVLVEVLIEVSYVLEVTCKMPRQKVGQFFQAMLDSEVIIFEHEVCVRQALAGYMSGGDFSDELITARSRDIGAGGLFSFDKKMIKSHPGFVTDTPGPQEKS